jgi:hypothetical protein
VYVIVAVPAVTPVTFPVIVFTVATAALDVVHTPPDVVLVKIVEEPIHAFMVPPIAARTGKSFTVTVTASVFTHPLASVPVTVYVVVAVGVATTLAVFVVAKPVTGLHTYVEAPVAVSVVLAPLQIVASLPATTTGIALTVIEELTDAVHPLASVTVYVIVVVPAATPVTTPLELIVAVAVLAVDHTPPPVAFVKVVVAPAQTAVAPLIVPAVGNALIVTVSVTALVQPFELV